MTQQDFINAAHTDRKARERAVYWLEWLNMVYGR